MKIPSILHVWKGTKTRQSARGGANTLANRGSLTMFRSLRDSFVLRVLNYEMLTCVP